MNPIPILLALCLLPGCSAAPDAPVPVNPGPFDGAVRIPVDDVELAGTIYVADGITPHPTLVWFHGFPGLPEPADATIAALRGAGLNVLYFNYRGAWGAPGEFSVANAREDARAALAYLREPEIARYYRVDVDALIPVGDSFGSWIALQTAAADSAVPCAAGALVFDLGMLGDQFIADIGVRNGFEQMFGSIAADPALSYQLAAGAEGLANEIAAGSRSNQLVDLARAFGDRPVLLIGADADELAPPTHHLEPLASVLRSASVISIPGGHELVDSEYAAALARWVLDGCR